MNRNKIKSGDQHSASFQYYQRVKYWQPHEHTENTIDHNGNSICHKRNWPMYITMLN